MNIRRSFKLGLLALTVWPVLYMFGFGAILAFVEIDPAMFDTLFTVHLITMVVSFALYGIYIVDLFRTSSVPRDMKALWGIAFLAGSCVAMVVYWFKHVWPEQHSSWPLDVVITDDSQVPRL